MMFTSCDTTEESVKTNTSGVWALDPLFESRRRTRFNLFIGMNQERVQNLLGYPKSKYRSKDPGSEVEIWVYEREVKGPPGSSSINSVLGATTVTDFLMFIDTVTIEFNRKHLRNVTIKRQDERVMPSAIPR